MIKVFFEGSIFLHQKRGGISKYIQKINENLFKYNIKSIIFSPITINENLKINKKNDIFYFRIKKIPKFFTKFFYFFNNLLTMFYIKIFKPDILHFSYYNKALKNFIRIPYVLTIYDLIHEKLKLDTQNFEKSNLIKRAKHIICISNQTKKELIRFYKVKKEKISVIYLGIDQNNFYKSKRKKNKKNFILFVGPRNRYKNFINFIKAYSKSKYLIDTYKVVCFGNERFNTSELETFDKLGIIKNIIFKSGNDSELYRNYRDASLFVTTSLYEGFGLTPLEAMKFGCPVICSNIPTFKEVLGNSCEYVNPRNVQDIKKKIENVLRSKEKQKKLIKNGFKRIKKFSWKKCTYETTQVYKRIIT